MSEQVNSTPNEPKLYYLPGDKSKTPLSHDDYVNFMRVYWRRRKQLQRLGECNAPASHPCCCDCTGCPYKTRKYCVSLDGLKDSGFDAADSEDLAETVIRKMIMAQIKTAFPKLDQIDRIVIKSKIIRQPALTDRECAALITKVTGESYSHQAVGKRLPKALERLRVLAGIDFDN